MRKMDIKKGGITKDFAHAIMKKWRHGGVVVSVPDSQCRRSETEFCQHVVSLDMKLATHSLSPPMRI